MPSGVPLAFGLALLVGGAVVCTGQATTGPQRIEPLNPGVEQRVEPVQDEREQHVAAVDPVTEQDVGVHVPPTPAEKRASQVGKFLLGVTAAVIAVGVMVAELIFI